MAFCTTEEHCHGWAQEVRISVGVWDAGEQILTAGGSGNTVEVFQSPSLDGSRELSLLSSIPVYTDGDKAPDNEFVLSGAGLTA